VGGGIAPAVTLFNIEYRLRVGAAREIWRGCPPLDGDRKPKRWEQLRVPFRTDQEISMMKRNVVIVLAVMCIPSSMGLGQVTLGGQTAVSFFKSASTGSQREVNDARPSFGWRSDLFLHGNVSENVTALCDVRVSDDQSINFDLLAIRLMNLTPLRLNLLAGRIDLPFGNLGERWFPRKNLLYGLPVIYEYRTALPDHITTEAELLATRGQGQGMRLLDLGLYDLGGMVSGSVDILDYAVAVTSGTISETSYLNGNSNSDLGMIFRLAATPMTGMSIRTDNGRWKLILSSAADTLSFMVRRSSIPGLFLLTAGTRISRFSGITSRGSTPSCRASISPFVSAAYDLATLSFNRPCNPGITTSRSWKVAWDTS
jgi:hypothetical protein